MKRSRLARVMTGALVAAGVAFFTSPVANAAPEELTLGQLSANQAKLDKAASSRPDTVTGWYVDEASKSLVVSVHGSDAGVARWAAKHGAGQVRIEKVAEAPRLHRDTLGVQAWWNVVGGRQLTSSTGAQCSVGFPVISGNTRYVVTAGHCTALGGTWSGTGGVIGTATTTSFPGNDYGLIQVTGPEVAFSPWVDRYNGFIAEVTYAAAPNVGDQVCHSGTATHWRCGQVTGVNQTICYTAGCVNQMIRTNLCSAPADSGGSLVTQPGSTVAALGLISGATGSCGGTASTYYQPILEVLAAANATLPASG